MLIVHSKLGGGEKRLIPILMPVKPIRGIPEEKEEEEGEDYYYAAVWIPSSEEGKGRRALPSDLQSTLPPCLLAVTFFQEREGEFPKYLNMQETKNVDT